MASTRTPSARSRPAARRPGAPPALGAQNAIDCILARLADVGDPLDAIDSEIRAWAAAMLRDGESTGGSEATRRRIVAPNGGSN